MSCSSSAELAERATKDRTSRSSSAELAERAAKDRTSCSSSAELPGPEQRVRVAEEDLDTMDCGKAVAIFLMVAAPNVLLIACFSGIGSGLEFFNVVAPCSLNGDFAFCATALVVALLYILDWPNWPQICRVCSLLLPCALGVAGTVLKGRKYPWSPMVMCLTLEVLCIGALRAGPCRASNRVHFFRVTYGAMFIVSLVMGGIWVIWVATGMKWGLTVEEDWAGRSGPIYDHMYKMRALNYAEDCSLSKNVSSLSSEERADVRKACSLAGTVLFIVWACPFVGAFYNFVMGAFICLNSTVHQIDQQQLEHDMKRFLLTFSLLVMGMYGSTSLSSTSLRLGSTIMAFFAAGLVALCGWVYLEVGKKAISLQVEKHVGKSLFAGMCLEAAQSDWAKAIFIGALNVLIVVLYYLELARRRLRCMTHCLGGGAKDRFTQIAEEVTRTLAAFNWASVLSKICILGELFFVFQVGVAKATYVFLSWTNGVLAAYSFGLVVAIVFFVGYVMFLLPPVPGVPVYVFCGVVIADQGQRTASVGFSGGCLIAIAVAFLLKLTACCGQYAIGCLLGRSVKVQQLIGVDQVPTRAIQQILERRGLDLGKVAVLVGGPDWPVSVTCGILRLSVFQMLLGTAPVFFVLTPCVLAGAFLTRATGRDESVWNMLAGGFTATSVGVLMGSGFLAVYAMTNVIEKDGKELVKPRPEHKAVEELTKREEAYRQAYVKATRWQSLHSIRKFVLLAATCLMLLSGFTFAFLDELCFENFSVSGKIAAPLDENGLGGNALNIVRAPTGAGAMAVFSIATLLHAIFVADTECLARRELAKPKGVVLSTPQEEQPH